MNARRCAICLSSKGQLSAYTIALQALRIKTEDVGCYAHLKCIRAKQAVVGGGYTARDRIAELEGVLAELVNSPNAKSNAMWDRAREILEAKV